jgi:predicted nucleotidyltransferase
MVERRLTAMIRALHDAGVEFVVVGGLSAVLNGAPVNTFDIDVVHRRTPENVDRIMPVLETLDAVYRIQPERRLRPAESALVSAGHQNLITKYGPLDLLGTIGNDLGYEELVPRSTEILVAEGVRVRILNLEALIEVKEQLNGEKDRAMLPILRHALEENRRKGAS